MMLVLLGFGGISLVELLLYIRPLWQVRKTVAAGLILALAAANGALVVSYPHLISLSVLVLSGYRCLNLLRVIQSKMHVEYLQHVTRRTTVWLLGIQLISLGLWPLWSHSQFQQWLLVGAIVSLVVSFGIYVVSLLQVGGSQPPKLAKYLADRDLPSISVCIPARNETMNLEDCLRSLLASNYPKLEILVLDDASHDRTPDIIKSFAHDGVRFIRGDAAPGAWLAKNWAYQRLFQEASGKYLMFCGVDVRMGPTALREMVEIAANQRAQMLSFLPKNIQNRGWRQELSILLQPMRYAWELGLPRAQFGRPPVLSTTWLVERRFMEQYGGFAAVSRMITPESYFARQAAQRHGYRFYKTTASMAVITRKSVADQWDTAVRTRYPQVHKRPELVLLLSLVQLSLLVAPFIGLIVSIIQRDWLMMGLSLATCGFAASAYATITRLTYRRFQWRSLAALPFALLLDIVVRHYSMWRYEFKEVVWKGRDVTEPVMHVLPRLPDLQ